MGELISLELPGKEKQLRETAGLGQTVYPKGHSSLRSELFRKLLGLCVNALISSDALSDQQKHQSTATHLALTPYSTVVTGRETQLLWAPKTLQ